MTCSGYDKCRQLSKIENTSPFYKVYCCSVNYWTWATESICAKILLNRYDEKEFERNLQVHGSSFSFREIILSAVLLIGLAILIEILYKSISNFSKPFLLLSAQNSTKTKDILNDINNGLTTFVSERKELSQIQSAYDGLNIKIEKAIENWISVKEDIEIYLDELQNKTLSEESSSIFSKSLENLKIIRDQFKEISSQNSRSLRALARTDITSLGVKFKKLKQKITFSVETINSLKHNTVLGLHVKELSLIFANILDLAFLSANTFHLRLDCEKLNSAIFKFQSRLMNFEKLVQTHSFNEIKTNQTIGINNLLSGAENSHTAIAEILSTYHKNDGTSILVYQIQNSSITRPVIRFPEIFNYRSEIAQHEKMIKKQEEKISILQYELDLAKLQRLANASHTLHPNQQIRQDQLEAFKHNLGNLELEGESMQVHCSTVQDNESRNFAVLQSAPASINDRTTLRVGNIVEKQNVPNSDHKLEVQASNSTPEPVSMVDQILKHVEDVSKDSQLSTKRNKNKTYDHMDKIWSLERLNKEKEGKISYQKHQIEYLKNQIVNWKKLYIDIQTNCNLNHKAKKTKTWLKKNESVVFFPNPDDYGLDNVPKLNPIPSNKVL